MLSPYKVLDLSDERGHLCGQILGDLGADVVLVEPPTGSLSRHAGPFNKDQPHRDRSLGFWAFNRNKRSITLDLEIEADLAPGDELVQKSFRGGRHVPPTLAIAVDAKREFLRLPFFEASQFEIGRAHV